MGEYFIGSDGELYHWQLKNHKYISREKKNGKWVYTYPEDKASKSGGAVETALKEGIKRAVDKGVKNATKTPLSNEYMIEKAYNSKTNSGSNRVDAGRNALGTNKSSSGDYASELAYNSQKNNYGDAAKKIEEKKSEEKKTSWLEKAKQKLDNLGDWASDKLKDAGDSIGDFAEDAKDWVDDKLDDLYDATIGEAKDALGYDERDHFYEAKQEYDRCDKTISDKMDRFTNVKMSNSNASADSVNSVAKTLEYDFQDWAKADAEYAYAKAKYDASIIGRIDNWINGNDIKPKSDAEIEELRIVARAMQGDASLAMREGKYLANTLISDILFFGAHPLSTSKEINVHSNSVKTWDDLMEYTRLGEEMGHWSGTRYSSIEMDRLERMRVELYMRYVYKGQ